MYVHFASCVQGNSRKTHNIVFTVKVLIESTRKKLPQTTLARFPGFLNIRSCHRRCSVKKDVLKNFAIFTGKHLCLIESPFNKVARLKTSQFIKKRLQHLCLIVNIAKSLRTTILKNICERLLLMRSGKCLLQTFNSFSVLVLKNSKILKQKNSKNLKPRFHAALCKTLAYEKA